MDFENSVNLLYEESVEPEEEGTVVVSFWDSFSGAGEGELDILVYERWVGQAD